MGIGFLDGGCGNSRGWFSRMGFRVVGDFDRLISVIRRGFQRWGFQFGVQRVALDLFRIKDVCHNCQLRDFGRRSRIPPYRLQDGWSNRTRPASTLQISSPLAFRFRADREDSGIAGSTSTLSSARSPGATMRVADYAA